jgi:DNA-binding SARP family transcriptional activator
MRLLGPTAVWKDGVEAPLPPSRKARALLAYLAVAPGPVTRSQLCCKR